MLIAKLVSSDNELVQIAALSRDNLVSNITKETQQQEGFVSWPYTLEVLQRLHDLIPSVIVKEGDLVAGYALVLTREAAGIYPPLADALAHFEKIHYKGRALSDFRMYVMGQICVHPDYRGKGVFQLLYQFHRQQFSPAYDLLVTEISTRNVRSLRAHLKTGFTVVDTVYDEEGEWQVVVWDWSLSPRQV
jgi:GNAT superfamily N-acetyltransferase